MADNVKRNITENYTNLKANEIFCTQVLLMDEFRARSEKYSISPQVSSSSFD